MELGNFIFGNSRGKYQVSRDLDDIFQKFLQDIYCDNYGYAYDIHNKELINSRYGLTVNGIFEILPYYWGSNEEESLRHNFVFFPDNLEIDWYKYPFRDSYSNKELSKTYLECVIKRCKEELNKLMEDKDGI